MSKGFPLHHGRMRPVLRSTVALALVASLGACVEGGNFPMFQQAKPEASSADTPTRRATRLIERDIEAPEIFQVTEAGLWDGRPSLGGVWVAHPDVKEPERVLIRNTANGQFVIGALFRRERENPGPRVQVSSDAAAALGMLAGAPVNLNVTALKREESPTEETVDAPVAEAPQAGTGTEATPGAIASAAAAIDTAEAGSDIGTADAAAAQGLPAADAATDTAAATAAAPEPQKKGFFASLFGKRQARSAAPTPAQAAATTAPGAAGGEALKASAVVTQTLDPAPGADPAAALGSQLPKTSPGAQPVKASAPAPATPAPKASGLARPFLQIGIFSVEENAENTATAMRQKGMIPTVRKHHSRGKDYWRVVIGPATTEADQKAILAKVKAAGFTDAYAVAN